MHGSAYSAICGLNLNTACILACWVRNYTELHLPARHMPEKLAHAGSAPTHACVDQRDVRIDLATSFDAATARVNSD